MDFQSKTLSFSMWRVILKDICNSIFFFLQYESLYDFQFGDFRVYILYFIYILEFQSIC